MARLKPPQKPKTTAERSSTNLALTVAQKALFDRAAALSGETRSSWMRRTLLERARETLKEKNDG